MEGETDRTVIGDLMLEIRLLLPLLHLTCPLFVWLACQVSILGPHVRFHPCFQKKKKVAVMTTERSGNQSCAYLGVYNVNTL